MPKIRIKYETADETGVTGFKIHMDDGSIWTCDKNGENWEKQVCTDEELQEKFNLWLAQNEKK